MSDESDTFEKSRDNDMAVAHSQAAQEGCKVSAHDAFMTEIAGRRAANSSQVSQA